MKRKIKRNAVFFYLCFFGIIPFFNICIIKEIYTFIAADDDYGSGSCFCIFCNFFKFEVKKLNFGFITYFNIYNDIFCVFGNFEFSIKFQYSAVMFGIPFVSSLDGGVVY